MAIVITIMAHSDRRVGEKVFFFLQESEPRRDCSSDVLVGRCKKKKNRLMVAGLIKEGGCER